MYLNNCLASICSVYFEDSILVERSQWKSNLRNPTNGETYMKTCPQADHQSCVGLTTSRPWSCEGSSNKGCSEWCQVVGKNKATIPLQALLSQTSWLNNIIFRLSDKPIGLRQVAIMNLGCDFVGINKSLCECFFLRTPAYVYLFCSKSGFVGEFTNTHYKMTRILFVYL